jgi:hypothetical protein
VRRRPVSRSNSAITASPIGNIIAAVAVFEIQSETDAVASSSPNSRRLGSVPTTRITASAMRRCRFHCCMAAAMPIPPRNRKM